MKTSIKILIILSFFIMGCGSYQYSSYYSNVEDRKQINRNKPKVNIYGSYNFNNWRWNNWDNLWGFNNWYNNWNIWGYNYGWGNNNWWWNSPYHWGWGRNFYAVPRYHVVVPQIRQRIQPRFRTNQPRPRNRGTQTRVNVGRRSTTPPCCETPRSSSNQSRATLPIQRPNPRSTRSYGTQTRVNVGRRSTARSNGSRN